MSTRNELHTYLQSNRLTPDSARELSVKTEQLVVATPSVAVSVF